jgi:hypothetical protein
MKQHPVLLRRIGIGAIAISLVAALAFVALRTGPLAPVKVTVTSVQEGKLNPPFSVSARWKRGAAGWSAPRWPGAC